MEDEQDYSQSAEVARGTFWGLLGTLALKLVSFAYIIYIARTISQDDLGLFYLSISILGVLAAWKDLGLPSAIVRFVPYFESQRMGKKIYSVLAASYWITAICGMLLSALAWVGADYVGLAYNNPGLPHAIRLIAAFILFDNLLRVNTSYLQGRADIKKTQAILNLQNVLKLAFTILLFTLYGPSLESIAGAFVASYLVCWLVSIPAVYSRVVDLEWRGQGMAMRSVLVELMPFGLMLTAIQVVGTVVTYADRAILGYLAPPAQANEAVAIYSIVSLMGINLSIFPSAVGAIFMPIISRTLGKRDSDEMRRSIGTAQRWILFITVPMVVATIGFASEMLLAFYGKQYESGGLAMAIFAVGQLFIAIAQPTLMVLAAMRLVKLELKIALACGIANVLFCLLLIPPFGMEGAAAASVLSFLFYAALFEHYGKVMLKFSSPAETYRLLFAGVLTLGAILLAKPYALAAFGAFSEAASIGSLGPYVSKAAYLLFLGAMSGVAFGVFVALALYLKCMGKDEIVLAKRAAKRARLPEFLISWFDTVFSRGVRPEQKVD